VVVNGESTLHILEKRLAAGQQQASIIIIKMIDLNFLNHYMASATSHQQPKMALYDLLANDLVVAFLQARDHVY